MCGGLLTFTRLPVSGLGVVHVVWCAGVGWGGVASWGLLSSSVEFNLGEAFTDCGVKACSRGQQHWYSLTDSQHVNRGNLARSTITKYGSPLQCNL